MMEPKLGRKWPALATLLLVADVSIMLAVFWTELRRPAGSIGDSDVIFPLVLIAFPAVGWLLALRRPGNPLGWIYLSYPVVLAIGYAIDEYAVAMADTGSSATTAILLIVGSWVTFMGYWLLIGPGIILFPDGRVYKSSFRVALWGSLASALGWGVIVAIGTDAICVAPFGEAPDPCPQTVQNPLVLAVISGLGEFADTLLEVVFYFTFGTSTLSVILRYLRSKGEVRQQIKWVAWAASLGLLGLIIASVLGNMFAWIDKGWGDLISFSIIAVGLPTAIGVAILKHRLYDIDRIISRSMSYTLVAGVLAAIFGINVALTQRLLPFQDQFSVVVSTLAVAAFFNPLRRKVQVAVDRHFNRSYYDSQKTLEAFAQKVRDEVQLERLAAALIQAVEDTLQPASNSIWLAPIADSGHSAGNAPIEG